MNWYRFNIGGFIIASRTDQYGRKYEVAYEDSVIAPNHRDAWSLAFQRVCLYARQNGFKMIVPYLQCRLEMPKKMQDNPKKEITIKTAYLLRGKRGAIIGVFPSMEALRANQPYSDGYERNDFKDRRGLSLEHFYSIEEIPMFTDEKPNSAIRMLIHRHRNDVFTPTRLF